MDVVVAGGHGKVGLRLLKLLAARGDRARGQIRDRTGLASGSIFAASRKTSNPLAGSGSSRPMAQRYNAQPLGL